MKLCKICNLKDWDNPDFQEALLDLSIPDAQQKIHRKNWEFAMGLLALKVHNKLHENAVALGIGSGHELFMYYLANKVKHVYATDIYGVGSFSNREAQANILTDPAYFAPFPYREDHLTVQFMDARYLLYESNTFDIVFSFSSIEHFGSRDDIKQAMSEIGRVLKPGGLAVIATEAILNDQTHPEFFQPDELIPVFAEQAQLEVVDDTIDFTISDEFLKNPLQQHQWEGVFPHITLQTDGVVFTSVFLGLRKPENAAEPDPVQIDQDLRLQISHLSLNFNDLPPLPDLSIQLKPTRLGSIPVVGGWFNQLRFKFHELIIYYLQLVSQPLSRSLQILKKQQRLHMDYSAKLLQKSEHMTTRAELKALQTQVYELEQQVKLLRDVINAKPK